MKTQKQYKTSLDRELFNLFREIYSDEGAAEDAVRDAKKAFSFIRHDSLYRAIGINEEIQ